MSAIDYDDPKLCQDFFDAGFVGVTKEQFNQCRNYRT